MTARRRRPEPPPVYAIADSGALPDDRLAAAVAEMAAAGVGWIQLRAKDLDGGALFRRLEACSRALEGSGAALWMDDRADLAALFPVAGVHLGQRDLPPAAARKVVGERLWVGSSTHDDRQVLAADADPEVDVVAIGPVYATSGKKRPDPVVGLAGLRRARALTAKPLVAIGGIDPERLPRVLAAGADSAAVLGAVCRGDVASNCRRLLRAAGEAR